VFGRNFKTGVIKIPETDLPGPAGPGRNQYRFTIDMPGARRWDLNTPWLYQLQATLFNEKGRRLDTAVRVIRHAFVPDGHGK